jgi:cation-transporting ATPase E
VFGPSSWRSRLTPGATGPGFTGRVLRFATPAGLLVAAATFAAYCLAHVSGLPLAQQRTAATLVTLTLSLWVLTLLAEPLT